MKAGEDRLALAVEAACRIDAIFAIEREMINGLVIDNRCAARHNPSGRRSTSLQNGCAQNAAGYCAARILPKKRIICSSAQALGVFTRFLDDGRICLSNNAAERELRGIALGRKSWLFAGSDRGGERAAVMLTLIHTAKLNDVDPQAWLADVLARLPDHSARRIDELLPWNWKRLREQRAAA